MSSLRFLLSAVALVACSAPAANEKPALGAPPRPAPPLGDAALAGAPRSSPEDLPVGGSPQSILGWAAGVPISIEDLLLAWHEVSTREVWLVVEKLVATRIALAEAARIGLELDPAALDAAVSEERAELEAEAAKAEGSPSVEAYIRNTFGMDPAPYLERMRQAAIRQMVAERAIRVWTLSNETRAIRVIAVSLKEEMRAIQAALAVGGDFTELAKRHSADETAETDGLVPFLVRQEHSPLARLGFATPLGEVGGPLWISGHGFLVRVEEERAPLSGDWPAVGDAVERSLVEHPVSDAEFIHWKIQMEKSYPVDLEPLKRLLGSKVSP